MQERDDERGDDALMAAYAEGDARAFDELFERHRRPLFTFLLHQSGSRSLAEDLFQEVFLRLIRSRSRYRPARAFRSWLFTIAHNALTDGRRRAALREPDRNPTQEVDMRSPASEAAAAAPADDTATNDPLAAAHGRDLGARIEAALQRLPENQREVFVLREQGGLDFQGIAAATGANLATVKSRMRYALAGLRQLLAAESTSLAELSHD